MRKKEALALRELIGALNASTIRVDSKGRTIITMPASERGRFCNALMDTMEAVKL